MNFSRGCDRCLPINSLCSVNGDASWYLLHGHLLRNLQMHKLPDETNGAEQQKSGRNQELEQSIPSRLFTSGAGSSASAKSQRTATLASALVSLILWLNAGIGNRKKIRKNSASDQGRSGGGANWRGRAIDEEHPPRRGAGTYARGRGCMRPRTSSRRRARPPPSPW